MTPDLEWRSLDVVAAEGMTLRVGAFRASDGTVVEFTPDVLKKVFSKVKNPVPIYLTHDGADSTQPRQVLGHVVKLGLEASGDKIHYKAIMMDPNFKLAYVAGYDDTSAEIKPIPDETGRIVDGELTGIAVVPNPAISGTQMKVSQLAFSGTTETASGVTVLNNNVTTIPSGGIKLTGKKLENVLLESGVPADKLDSLVSSLDGHYAKKFEQAALTKKFEEQAEQLKFACSERDEYKKKFEDASNAMSAIHQERVATLVNDIKGLKFENPEAVVAGLAPEQQIVALSELKKSLVAAKPAVQASVGLEAPPVNNQPDLIKEMGLQEMWDSYHKPVGGS